MATTTFSTRIDADLKRRLEQIAQYEDRSASYLANQAIRTLVEEREATHALVRTGLDLVAIGDTLEEGDIDAWLEAEDGTAFPNAKPR